MANFKNREYVIDGERLPSVTEVLRGVGLIRGFGSCEHLERGTAVHEACCAVDLGLDYDLPEEWKGYVMAYMAFLSDFRPEPVMIEQGVWHDVHRYAGTLDRVYLIDGERWIADIKTGSPERYYPVQLAAYSACLPKPIWKRMVVLLKESGEYGVLRYKAAESPADFEVFLAALKIWRYMR